MAYALGANPGTAPNSNTFTSDIGSLTRLATSGVFSKYLQEEIFESSAMVQSGLIQTDSRLNNITGVIAELPFFAPLNYDEEVLDSSSSWGDQGIGVLTWQKQTAGTQFGVHTNRTAGFSMDDLSVVETGEDALANIRSQLARDMNRKLTGKVISHLSGLFGAALADHVLSIATEADDYTGYSDANYLNAGAVTQAKSKLGERGGELSVIVMHSAVAYHLQAIGMLTFLNSGGTVNYASNGIGQTSTDVAYFAGLRCVIDDQCPKSTTAGKTPIYTCYLASNGVIRTGSQFPITIKTAESIDTWTQQMAVKYNTIHHVLGTSWKGSTNTGLSNTALATAGNWELAFSDSRLIPLVSIDCATPYGGVNA
ncbi:MAG: hypothetical protein CMA72_06025 [Euryarchaeota archaeon]|nr:hypothetical protein [Euryarchaeota archaeon]|tara:strand:+ start:4630 stop:5733 length:1104 start_codon:yes stop_codon:yes gene_type:complete